MKIFFTILTAMLSLGAVAANDQYLVPGDNLHIEGIPKIPLELVNNLRSYTAFRASNVIAWHPTQPGLVISTRLKNTTQLYYLAKPGDTPEALTDFKEAVSSASFQPKHGDYLLFERAIGGNEVYQLFRLDLASKLVTPISDAKQRASGPSWNPAGDRIAYSTVTVDSTSAESLTQPPAPVPATTSLHIVDPLHPETDKVIAKWQGGGWGGFRFSPDGERLVYQEYVSANLSHLWWLDTKTGAQHQITPLHKTGGPETYYGDARFARDGKHLFALTDHNSEFRRLALIDLESGKETILTDTLHFDVAEFSVSYKAGRIAFITNEEGSLVLRFLDLNTMKQMPRPALISGEISNLRWSKIGDEEIDEAHTADGKELAFNVTSSRSAGDVYTLNLASAKITRWTNGASAELNPLDFVEPTLIRWKSFDGQDISGFRYQPDASKHKGPRPVLINIHGGPESQAKPGFLGRSNYFVNDLGIAIIAPNVRGSSGFGKTFLALDNGKKREDSVADIGALLKWIRTQPDLDANRVMVAGGSYGGYMSLAVATHYSDQIAGAIDIVGISNWVTFLTNTESYRRDLRRAEYGDERDADMRAFMEKISPLNNAANISKPLFVIQGRNDPRVPYTEAEQIVTQLKKQKTPVWYLLANDEGHGFAKRINIDYLFYAQTLFLQDTLLKGVER